MRSLQTPILTDPSPFDWDMDFMIHFTDEKFSLWWAPVYIMDNIFARMMYLAQGTGDLYFRCGVFEGYHA